MRAEKQQLRKHLRALREAMPAQEKWQCDEAIRARVLALPEWMAAQTVFMYVSVGAEPDTRGLINEALKQGKQVLVPRCVQGSPGEMQLCRLRAVDELRPAPFGLLEPDAACEAVNPSCVDFAVVPCIACDAACNRLGQGGGYYDRLLVKNSFPTAALAYRQTLIERVPCESWDRPVNLVVTPYEVYVNPFKKPL